MRKKAVLKTRVLRGPAVVGSARCPVCEGALEPSNQKKVAACLTCGGCRGCALVYTPDGAAGPRGEEPDECLFCEFSLKMSEEWGP